MTTNIWEKILLAYFESVIIENNCLTKYTRKFMGVNIDTKM